LSRVRDAGSPGPDPSWVARAVALWAVLAGLFFMHGAAPPAGGCQGSPVTAVTAAAVRAMPGADMASAVTDTAHLAVTGTAAKMAVAAPTQHAASAIPAVSRATALVRDSCGHAMLCSSRQPRQSYPSAAGIPPANAAFFLAAPVLPGLAGVSRPVRPPGRPGLPLPLFLGVSRT
jgi:hypothetical protein